MTINQTATKPESELTEFFGPKRPSSTPAPKQAQPATKPDTSDLLRELIDVNRSQLEATREMRRLLGLLAGKLETMTAQTQQTADYAMAAVEQMKNTAGVIRLFCETATPQAGTAPQPQANGLKYEDVEMTTLIMTYNDKGEPSYKMTGGRYSKLGVRVWPEVLATLSIDATTLKPGPNPCARTVRVALKLDDEDGTYKAQKVTGLSK
jgi:hypothetical protein